MAAMNFPSSPSNGDTYTNPDTGVTYTYDGTDAKWKTTVTSNAFLPLSGGTLTGALSVTDIKHPSSASNNIVLDSSGNVALQAGSASTPALQPTGDTNTGIFFPAADTIAFAEGGSEAARIDSSGRLLVGTSISPSTGEGQYSQLVVQGYVGANQDMGTMSIQRGTDAYNVNSGIGRIQFTNNSGNAYATIASFIDGTTGSGDYPGRLVFSTTADGASSPTERMRIKANGTTNTYGPGDTFWIATSESAGTSQAMLVGSNGASGINGGSVCVKILSNGNLQNTNNSYGALSDAKLKENIVNAGSQWDDLKALQVRKYNFKEGQTHTQIGLIAQEAELVSPGLVSETPDRDEEGNDLGTVTKSINYSVLYMKAVKALQEAIERIETLEAKVAALEAS